VWAAAALMSGLLGCGADEPGNGGRFGSVSCVDDKGDTALNNSVVDQTADPGERVPAGLVDLVTTEVALQAPGTIVVTYRLGIDVARSAEDVDPELVEPWRLVTRFDTGHRVVLALRRDPTGDGVILDPTFAGRFESRRQVTADEEAVVDVDAELRDGQGVPFPGVTGFSAELDRDGPLGVEATIDGAVVTVRITAVDEYLDDDQFPFAEVSEIVAASPRDNRIDFCEGPIAFGE
jgi:hypothetical protein